MSLYSPNAKVSAVIDYFQNHQGLLSRDYWLSLDMTVHKDEPFFLPFVAFCSATKLINDDYYYSTDQPSYPKRTPVNYDLISPTTAELSVAFVAEQDNINEVSDSNYNGYMARSNTTYKSPTYQDYFSQTPYLGTQTVPHPLQAIWDAARVLDSLAKSRNEDLPYGGGLGISISENKPEGKFNVKIRAIVTLVSPMLPFFSVLKPTSY